MVNISLFTNAVYIQAQCGDLWNRLMHEVLMKGGLNGDTGPAFKELLTGEKYEIIAVEEDGKSYCRITSILKMDTPREFLKVLGNSEVIKTAENLVYFMLDLYHEVTGSKQPEVKSLADSFYD